MSRTDVHRPWRVQTADPFNRHLLRAYSMYLGQWQYTSHKNIGCGCRICTNHWGRFWDRRKERVAWRKVRHTLLRTANDELDGADVGSVRGSWSRSY